MYGETERFEKKIWTVSGDVKWQGLALKTRLLSCTRSYSKNADGRHSQDLVQKDHHGSSCASLHCAAEPVPNLTSEAHSSVCSGIAQLCRESQEAKVGAASSFRVWSGLQWPLSLTWNKEPEHILPSHGLEPQAVASVYVDW